MKRTSSTRLAASLAALLLLLPVSSFAEFTQQDFQKMLNEYLASEDGQKAVAESAQKHFERQEKDKQLQAAKQQEQEMERQFANPVQLAVGGSPTKGPADAKVTIFEFSDFECPFCSRGKDTIAQVAKAYPNDVRFVFKNLPLAFHANAEPAGLAALAANEQGKFWEFYEKLFENQKNLSAETYEQIAKDLGLNMEKFRTDVASDKIKNQMEEDKKLAAQHGIRGTPGFFVNGVAVRGAYPFDYFKRIIDRWLEKEQG